MKMQEKGEFEILMDEIIKAIVKETSITKKGTKARIPLITRNILEMLKNLNKQIGEQSEYIKILENQLRRLEKDFKALIKELTSAGYINLIERRNLLKRGSLTQEALINLLKKKGLVNSKDLHAELNRLKDKLPRSRKALTVKLL